eukprot:TRINITY_DN11947_c0_g1_i1.p1 TRINITY_DN11947_c0_g1~~TRINITY_DN11947_c0_g1_i1.p1  ORF type:complete len:447 (-),score=93.72 TRINITY_DN11947_c0_g1_i1:115-1455(-)
MCIRDRPTECVVKIYVTGIAPNYLMPWQVQGQRKWNGTGFVISDRLIMTNAHVVEDNTVIQVQKQNNPKKFRAQLKCTAPHLDLAIVTVEEDAFWEELPAVRFNKQLPELYSEVKAVGFPTGGSTVCVTKGVLSRIDAQLYVHPRLCGLETGTRNSPGSTVVFQIDAAINPGNSGGPAFNDQGVVVGVSSSGLPNAQSVGYIIPASIATMFLEEFQATGKWSGQSELGVQCRQLENDTMRAFLGMDSEDTGVMVTETAPLGALHAVLQHGDVITHVDGLAVSNEGKVPLDSNGINVYLNADALITCKPKGATTVLGLLRAGERLEKTVVLGPIPPLAPRFHGYDCTPEFLILGGLVFVQASVPLKRQYYEARRQKQNQVAMSAVLWDRAMQGYKDTEDEAIVLLLRVLEHDVNIGYSIGGGRIFESRQGESPQKMREPAEIVGRGF